MPFLVSFIPVLALIAVLILVGSALIRGPLVRLVAVALVALGIYGYSTGKELAYGIASAHAPYHYAVRVTPSTGAVAIVSYDSVIAAIDRGSTVTASAYTLSSHSDLLAHLADAGSRGAHVDLALTGEGMGYAVSANRRLLDRERSFHIVLTHGPLHLKAIVVDHGAGGVFVSDRNWTPSDSVILKLPSSYALAVERAIIGDPHDAGALTTTKGASLDAESTALRGAHAWIVFESESFGANNPVYDALYTAAQRGVRVRVLVAQREYQGSPEEQDALTQLQRVGVHTGLSNNDQKIAVIDGRTAWLGSSNATAGVEDQVDWGFTSHDPAIIQQLTTTIGEDAR